MQFPLTFKYSLFFLCIVSFATCIDDSGNKLTTSVQTISTKQIPSNEILDSLLFQIHTQVNQNKYLEALSTSKIGDSISVKFKENYPLSRIKFIEKRVELLYNYGLSEKVIDKMDLLLGEAMPILKNNPNLIPQAKKLFYWKGITAYGKRNYKEGINYLLTAINLEKQNLNQIDTAFLVLCKSQISNLQKKNKEFEEAKLSFQNAFLLAKKLATESKEVQILIEDFTTYHIALGDSSNTFKYILQLEAISKEKKLISTESLKGIWFFKKNNFDKSIEHFKKVEQELENKSLYFQIDKLYSECFWMLSTMYLDKKQFDLAIHYLVKYLFIGINTPTNLKFDWSLLKEKRTSLPFSSRNFMLYAYLAEIVQIKAQHQNKDITKDSLLNISLEILEETDSMMYGYSLMANEEMANNFIQEVSLKYYPTAINICYNLYQKTNDIIFIDKANFFIERLKAFSLTKVISKNKIVEEQKAPLIQRLNAIDKAQKKLSEEIQQKDNEQSRINLGFLNYEKQNIIDSIQLRKANSFNKLMQKYFQPQKEISDFFEPKKNEVSILQYHLTKNKLFIIYNDAKNQIFIKRNLPEDFYNALLNYKKQLSFFQLDRKKKKEFNKSAQYLYELVVGDSLDELIQHKEKIIIIPNNDLADLPFETLMKNGKYWVQEKNIQYAFSLKTFLLNAKNTSFFSTESKVLAFSFSEKEVKKYKPIALLRGKKFGKLKGAATEVERLSKLFPNSESHFFFGEDCTKENFIQHTKKEYDIIHLALHAANNNQKKYNNFLIFKDSSNIKKASVLSEYEIESLTITSPLIILSACSTNRGKAVSGEGIYSLARAFKKAGAKTVITTLWEVDDQSTSQIIQLFYQKLKIGLSPEVALSIAKKEYLSKADNLLSHPFFWAGIVLIE